MCICEVCLCVNMCLHMCECACIHECVSVMGQQGVAQEAFLGPGGLGGCVSSVLVVQPLAFKNQAEKQDVFIMI